MFDIHLGSGGPVLPGASGLRIQDRHASLGGRTDHANPRRGSTAALSAEIRSVSRVLQMLDGVMQLLVTDQELLDAWVIVRRIPKRPSPTRGAQDGTTSSTTPATSAPSLTVESSVRAAAAAAVNTATSQPAAA